MSWGTSVSHLTRVAIGIIFNKGGEVLIALRPEDKRHSGFWEFPGGKIEKEETSLEGLKREIWEEVGLDIQSAEVLLEHHYVNDLEHTIYLEVFMVHAYVGDALGREGQAIAWVRPECLNEYKLLPANRMIVEALKRKKRHWNSQGRVQVTK